MLKFIFVKKWYYQAILDKLLSKIAFSTLPDTSLQNFLNAIFQYFYLICKKLGWYSKKFSKILQGVDLASTRISVGHTAIFVE